MRCDLMDKHYLVFSSLFKPSKVWGYGDVEFLAIATEMSLSIATEMSLSFTAESQNVDVGLMQM